MAVSPETTARSSIRTLFLLTLLVSDVVGRRGGTSQGVKYDSRSLIINGRRQLLFSGSVHYPRSTPEVENEYNNVAHAYKDAGLRYVQWVGNMAVALKTGVPWVMCKEKSAPGPVARVYENPGMKACAAFLSNSNRKIDGTVNFKGTDYYLPRRSISILPDCKTVISQHNARTFHVAKETSMNNRWQMHKDHVPRVRDTRVRSRKTLELFNMTKDTSDYLWYTTRYHVPRSLLKPKDNLMVVFKEHRGKPEGIVMMTVKRNNICTFVSELFPGQALSSLRESSKLRTVAHPEAHLKCTGKKVISSIAFASFGNPEGLCGNYSRGSCHAPQTKPVVEKVTFHYHATHLSSSTPTHPPLRSTLPDLLGKEELRVVDVV
ncbi:hypothetical protein BHE74_00030935 [Ensete ventricosum]|nr:hypothetical protein BHE74_00030935 [Ensete ventricosum]